jgi:hypothetical protein
MPKIFNNKIIDFEINLITQQHLQHASFAISFTLLSHHFYSDNFFRNHFDTSSVDLEIDNLFIFRIELQLSSLLLPMSNETFIIIC